MLYVWTYHIVHLFLCYRYGQHTCAILNELNSCSRYSTATNISCSVDEVEYSSGLFLSTILCSNNCEHCHHCELNQHVFSIHFQALSTFQIRGNFARGEQSGRTKSRIRQEEGRAHRIRETRRLTEEKRMGEKGESSLKLFTWCRSVAKVWLTVVRRHPQNPIDSL